MAGYVAHTPPDSDPEHWQSMQEHTENVAIQAMAFARPFGATELAQWASWLHDVGKYSDAFQSYLRACHAAKLAGDPMPRAGSAEHKSAGTKMALDLLPISVRNIVAPCVLGHHGGLNALSALKNGLAEAGAKQDLSVPIARAQQDLAFLNAPYDAAIPGLQTAANKRLHLEMLIRFVFSCLVDADSLDTEQHFLPEKAAMRRPVTLQDIGKAWLDVLAEVQALLQKDAADTAVNRVRREVYDACVQRAALPPGVFSLTVPTGGGKTRSSLAFALHHALAHKHERIIYAIPYTSIIDQTVAVFRGILGGDNILEHHSAIDVRVADSNESSDAAQGERAPEQQRRLASENWDAPLIVTTTVQLSESLFSNRTSRCRKLHHIANSVIILDEVQTLPAHLLAPLLSGLRALVEHYGVTIVLCTATQPALAGKTRYLEGLPEPVAIVTAPDAARHFDTLRRVTYSVAPEPWDWARVAQEMRAHSGSCMAVVNTKKDALALLAALNDPQARHLSTLLCGAHRKQVLEEVRAALLQERAGGPPLLLVATQVIEAGVDVDFPHVLRAKGPLDRMIQAAGRCNREGLRARADSHVIVFEPKEGSVPPGEYKLASDLAWSLVRERSDFDFDAPDVATAYFAKLYNLFGSNLDREKVQELREACNFPEVAQKVRLIDEDTIPVLVPYDRPEFDRLVGDIQIHQAGKLGMSRDLWRKVQPHSVAVYRRDLDKLQSMLEELVPDQLFAWRGKYDPVTGIGNSVGRDPSDLMA